MIGMLFAVLAVLLIQVMPVFHQVFEQLGLELSGTANAFYLLGQAMQRYSVVFLVLIFLIAGGLFAAWHLPGGKERLNSLWNRIPAFRKISMLLACSRFSGAMSRALRSGLDMDESFRLASELVEQPDFKEQVTQAQKKIDEGEDFAESLRAVGIYSGLNARMISIGTKTGASDLALEKIAVSCQEEADTRIQNLVSSLEPTIVAVLSILTGLILLSVMLPLLGVMSGIG
jgi:type IV pilus assembly protein PilC